ncbi:MAG TPA: LacI family DNA-binding transcriptional regulator, partial [Kribbella sp.]
MSRPPTSRDLARLAGVSQATVSRVLTNNPKVNAETRARVLQVLKDANYKPNALARAMKTGRTD